MLGVADKWKVRHSPLGLTYLPYGNENYFPGGG